jgi:hypothetical protein
VFVNETAPTPEEARAALAKADSQRALVRKADREFRWILAVVAAVYVVVALLVSISFPRRGSPVAGIAALLVIAGGLVAVVVLGRRMRAYSMAGIAWYVIAIAIFLLWNGVVTGVSLLSGWWSPKQPSYHFAISEALGAIPLIVAVWLFGRR